MLLTFFFFNDTATTEIYTLSLHDALPISLAIEPVRVQVIARLEPTIHFSPPFGLVTVRAPWILKLASESSKTVERSEEHTSELQSPCNLVCRLLLEKKNYTSCAYLA